MVLPPGSSEQQQMTDGLQMLLEDIL